ncbi:hypothetical protein [Helicobacter rodentium]|uniref:hypothetical protein n=1 Tax=Helicobacter rodentium TaxID=59617 RepID=UPI0025A641FA|nr:hypothetical protein [Helicobacter rodentium]
METLQTRFHIMDCCENFSNFLAMTKDQSICYSVIARRESTKQSIIMQKVNLCNLF